MSFEALNDFEFYSAVPDEVIEKYRDKIPPELLEIWQNYGFGTFDNGYIKIINPDDYIEVLEASYFAYDISVPILATGFADVITWEDNEYIGIVQYRKSDVSLYPFDFNNFLAKFKSSKYVVAFLDNDQYDDAIKLLGRIEYDECFGYSPLLALGGSNQVESLQKMKIFPHLDLIIEMAGCIE